LFSLFRPLLFSLKNIVFSKAIRELVRILVTFLFK
jgi:hypothetical protein